MGAGAQALRRSRGPVAREDSGPVDKEKAAALALRVWGYKQGEVVALMIHLGDRLCLYKAMAGSGPLTADQLAAGTGLDARWLLEWLRARGAAGLLQTTDGMHFELAPEGVEVLANDTDSTWFAAGAFHGYVATPESICLSTEALRTGRGLSYDDLGLSGAHSVERLTARWTKLVLVPRVLPALSGVVERLETGAQVADVGCGAGVALVAMATACPASHFHGYEPSAHAPPMPWTERGRRWRRLVSPRCHCTWLRPPICLQSRRTTSSSPSIASTTCRSGPRPWRPSEQASSPTARGSSRTFRALPPGRTTCAIPCWP